MQSNIAPQGMVVTPHHLATQTGINILRQGGTAMEAIVAAAATMVVVYPHLNNLGGDGFWLITPPYGNPLVIEACGAAGSLATDDFFKGLLKIPQRGPKSAITVPGMVGGWQEVLDYVTESGFKTMSTAQLLADAIRYAEDGSPVTNSIRHTLLFLLWNKLTNITNEFKEVYTLDGKIPAVGDKLYQKTLAKTLRSLVSNGLDSFYRGEIGRLIAEDANELGLPVTQSDLINYSTVRKSPLRLKHKLGYLYNVKPPSQGVVSLLILGMLDKLNIDGKNEGEFIHATVEATKLAFKLRDEFITDPKYMKIHPESLLNSDVIEKLANNINFDHAASSGPINAPGDTIWMGAMDNKGFSVSYIQSMYNLFGSAVLLPKTGIIWNNRGIFFSLNKNDILSVKPGKKPLFTLNPATVKFQDGRVMAYGSSGGDGQPQFQAAIFYRYAIQNLNVQASISAPRWLYGSTRNKSDTTLRMQDRFDNKTIAYLEGRGHNVEICSDAKDHMGEAGAIVRHVNGMMEGGFDPRSDGSSAGF